MVAERNQYRIVGLEMLLVKVHENENGIDKVREMELEIHSHYSLRELEKAL